MDIQIEGHHLEVTQPIHDHVNEKVGNLEKYSKSLVNVHVILSVEKQKRHTAEVICHVRGGNPLIGKTEGGDLYAVFDSALHKVKESLKKYKQLRRIEPRKESQRNDAMAHLTQSQAEDDVEES